MTISSELNQSESAREAEISAMPHGPAAERDLDGSLGQQTDIPSGKQNRQERPSPRPCLSGQGPGTSSRRCHVELGRAQPINAHRAERKLHMKRRLIRRNNQIRTIGLVGLVIALGLLLPALLATPDIGGALVLAAALPFGVMLRSPDYPFESGGGGSLTDDEEFRSKLLRGVETLSDRTKSLRTDVDKIKSVQNEFGTQLSAVRKSGLGRMAGDGARPKGKLSDEAASAMAYHFISLCARSGQLENVVRDPERRHSLMNETRSALGLSERALSTTEVPLPTTYGRELRELIAEFGVARKYMTRYPLSGGIDKPPRMGTRPAFASIAMAAAFVEVKPTLGFAELSPHKIGGIVIPPREISEQSSVDLGNFLAMYGAVEFARAEDTWGFKADGTATYESVKGVCTICLENSKYVQMAGGKTAASDATLENFRSIRGKVSTAALSGGKYYINQSFEQGLRGFNASNYEIPFQYRPDGKATLDGFEVVWTEVMQPFGTGSTASKVLAAFGRLDFWWMGEHSSPRIDTSKDVFFANDLLAVRFCEEIDFDYNAIDAMAVLQTAAS